MKEIYEPKFVENLFDKMSGAYAYMNYITSFGFSERWRKQCVEELHIEDKKVIILKSNISIIFTVAQVA